MKNEHITIFLVIIAIVFGIVYYFNAKPVEDKDVLKYTTGCDSEKIDDSIYKLKGTTSLIGAFISFDKVPIEEATKDELDKLGIQIDEDSQILDYMYATIPTEALCDLAEYDFVKRVFIPIEE